MTDIHIRESTSPRVKPSPKNTAILVPFAYFPSDDGTDENLLILLHGLGDTHIPFTKLGRQLKLPQTAILALRARERVPFLYEESYQWYESFDPLGDLILRPDPTPALDLLSKVVTHLVDDCTWPSCRIHLFGFAQGGSVAAEFGIAWWKQRLSSSDARSNGDHDQKGVGMFGSIVSISGPLLSYPTLSLLSPTPILIVHSPTQADAALPAGAITVYKKGYKDVTENTSRTAGMPSSQDGWKPIMEFWSKRLGRRPVEGLYEVMSGKASPP